MTDLQISPLSADTGADLGSMTFPAYRHLLDLAPCRRHPQEGGERLVQPYGLVATRAERPVGLVLAEAPLGDEAADAPQLLSLFVSPTERRGGIGGGLVAAVEEETRRRGFGELGALYTTGRPAIGWVERILERRGWDQPEPFSLSVRFAPSTALTSPAFDERRIRSLSRGLEIFPWSELGEDEALEIRRSNGESCWIEPSLEPWLLDPDALHSSSLGARYRGRVVGWVLNESVLPGVVRFTMSYMRKDLSRRGRILALYRASLLRIVEQGGCRFCTFLTPFSYPRMVRFIQRWIAPISSFVGESRKTRISLPPLA